jgi:hypothetical protein
MTTSKFLKYFLIVFVIQISFSSQQPPQQMSSWDWSDWLAYAAVAGLHLLTAVKLTEDIVFFVESHSSNRDKIKRIDELKKRLPSLINQVYNTWASVCCSKEGVKSRDAEINNRIKAAEENRNQLLLNLCENVKDQHKNDDLFYKQSLSVNEESLKFILSGISYLIFYDDSRQYQIYGYNPVTLKEFITVFKDAYRETEPIIKQKYREYMKKFDESSLQYKQVGEAIGDFEKHLEELKAYCIKKFYFQPKLKNVIKDHSYPLPRTYSLRRAINVIQEKKLKNYFRMKEEAKSLSDEEKLSQKINKLASRFEKNFCL